MGMFPLILCNMFRAYASVQGGAPSIALFANNFRKKREAYRGSEFAPRVLAEHGIPVVMKVRPFRFAQGCLLIKRHQSDHPVLNSRYLLFEAQQAHYFGLNPALALASVTSVPARAAGLGHRIGTIAEGKWLPWHYTSTSCSFRFPQR